MIKGFICSVDYKHDQVSVRIHMKNNNNNDKRKAHKYSVNGTDLHSCDWFIAYYILEWGSKE